jgi:hypothetical protein
MGGGSKRCAEDFAPIEPNLSVSLDTSPCDNNHIWRNPRPLAAKIRDLVRLAIGTGGGLDCAAPATGTMLFTCGQGEDGTRVFTVSSVRVQPKRNGVRLDHVSPCP